MQAHRGHPLRRRAHYAPHLCAFSAAALLLISLSFLHYGLSSSSSSSRSSLTFASDPLVNDTDNDAFDASPDDLIDQHDDGGDDADKPDKLSDADVDLDSDKAELSRNNGLFWDHLFAVARRSFGNPAAVGAIVEEARIPDRVMIAFGSDDLPVDEDIRMKLDSISSLEDLMLLKPRSTGDSLLRRGWASWLEGKADYLRRDKMLRSNLELLNPRNHPLLEDPDGPGVSSLTRGDRMMQQAIWKEIDSKPFGGDEMKRTERRRTLDLEMAEEQPPRRRWGFFPGLDPHLSFSAFMARFLERGECGLRVFMVWNSPGWMYGVRHQRGLESLLHHHRNACVVVLSETLELDFFRSFVKDGFKVAVAMPNLDELLKDTPPNVFASVWHEWRKTRFYPIHYSELVRLAALYKYGGVYIDSDIIVLRPLDSLKNTVAVKNQIDGTSVYSSAVMSFRKNSAFLMECLGEYFSTYDDTHLRWNGADLMTRIINKLTADKSSVLQDIKIEPSHAFFPIGPHNITSYFAVPADESERAQQDILIAKILNESTTFHFWNGMTSALVPESNSLVDRFLNLYCLRCSDVL